MAKFFDQLTDELQAFIQKQKMFFTATAPDEGRINLSPKGMDTFRCIDSNTVAYLDLTGSGNETAGHLQQNPRMTIMFCSFDKEPNILRLYGQGRVLSKTDPQWNEWNASFPQIPGARQIIILSIESAQTSCGFAVPYYEYISERDTLKKFAETKGDDGLKTYRSEKNQTTIDGKPTHFSE